jgi:putative Mg2+ transporter-C (MgtC) family protein
MEIEFDFDYEIALRLLLSFAIGTAIGIEREYRSKAAGLRTMIVICLGSTIFMEISLAVGGASPDRIASNIITGIGFLGAGVIFKDGLTITGITTATTIWICAALGMAVGAGEYFIALAGSVIVLLVLILLQDFQQIIERFHQARTYKVTYLDDGKFCPDFEATIKQLKLQFQRKKDLKNKKSALLLYEVYGREKYLDQLNIYLKNDSRVKAYEY